jgi:hypothetical protein
VFYGNRISPDDETAMENLARYIIRASFSQARMQYLDQEAKVVYTSKDGKVTKVFDALEWLAAMCSHVSDRGNRWSGIMDTIATSHGENGKRGRMMILFPVSSNPMESQGNNGENGQI